MHLGPCMSRTNEQRDGEGCLSVGTTAILWGYNRWDLYEELAGTTWGAISFVTCRIHVPGHLKCIQIRSLQIVTCVFTGPTEIHSVKGGEMLEVAQMLQDEITESLALNRVRYGIHDIHGQENPLLST